ncbi:hypothetical protein P3T35_003908 [Kitasatospora sp. GP30]|nr:hypothetical protein [Kitasatospora sp. GP30]
MRFGVVAERALSDCTVLPAQPGGTADYAQGCRVVDARLAPVGAGVTPWTPFGELPAPARVLAKAQRLLHANRMRPGHPTTGELRSDRSHWVYGRAGQPCRRCGTAIRTAGQGVAPQQRLAFWCPRCQRGAGARRGRLRGLGSAQVGEPAAAPVASSVPQRSIAACRSSARMPPSSSPLGQSSRGTRHITSNSLPSGSLA